MISKFEILPNEILLEIFEYLPTIYIYQTFFYLNQRYNSLLLSIRLRINLKNITKEMSDYYNYFLFPIASHLVVSLYCEDMFDRLIHHINLSNFISIEYLTIVNIKKSTLQYIISNLNQFSKLIYLNLQISNDRLDNELYFQEPMESIEKCILNFNRRILIQGNQSYINLRYLNINQYHIQDLISFLHIYTPKLQHLTVTLNDELNTQESFEKTNEKHLLESLMIKQCTIPFNRIEQLIFNSLPFLKQLNINTIGVDYADGRQWERVLSTYFPCLITFKLYTEFHQHEVPTANHRTQMLKTFDRIYFLSHHWYFAFAYHSSNQTINLFSIPLANNKIHVSLYDTHIEKTINDKSLFENVTELTLSLENSDTFLKLPNLSFNNVKNLTLISNFQQNQIQPRLMIVDLSSLILAPQLESLEFIGDHFHPSIYFLFEYTIKLHSITIPFDNLVQMTKALTDQRICQKLTNLIKHLTIKSINNLYNLPMFERLPLVFCHLESLSLYLTDPKDLYTLIVLILPKMSRILKRMNLFIEPYYHDDNILTEFMSCLIGYTHSHDLEKIDIKQTNNEINFCF